MPPSHYVTLDEIDSPRLPPADQPAQTSAATAKPGGSNLDDAIELSEVENILADYIHAIRAPLGAPGTATARPDANGVNTP